MNVLFLSVSTAVSNINNRGIYPDLLRYFVRMGHTVYIVCPFERRTKKSTALTVESNVFTLGVETLNITKSNSIEKFFATLLIEKQFERSIQKHFQNIKFDLILYTTPPITFNSLIGRLKHKHSARTYLMLKDIFPQNAVDLGLIKKNGLLYRFFRNKEKSLYDISDFIGCMSPANVDYVLNHNPSVNKEKVGLCPNAIEVIDRKKNIKDDLFQKYGIPANKKIFLYSGNLGIGQGIEFLIECLKECRDVKDAHFLIIGSGNRAELLKKWISNGHPKNVQFLDYLPKADFDLIEAWCDVGLVFLDYRFTIPNFPSRVLSYMEAGLPVIVCSDTVSDLGKIAEKNNFGFFCRSNDTVTFRKAVDTFSGSEKLIKDMGENSKKFLIGNFTTSIAYNNIISSI
ncbi:MAG: glycosyltransferase family 4 protein [Bacteroidia bacterium]|nr:glycosyltransferase family 4 protein [Bacteroidia bacterium]